MGVVNNLRRSRAIERLTRNVPSPYKEYLSVVMTAYPDERLYEFADIAATRTRWNISENPSGFGREHHGLMDALNHLIRSATIESAGILQLLTENVRLMKDIAKKHDPDGKLYPKAQRIIADDSIQYAFYFMMRPHATTKQKHALLTVVFLTHEQDNNVIPHFFQSLNPNRSRNNYAKIIADRIMREPDVDLIAVAEDFMKRTERRCKLEERFKYPLSDADNICDYPEHILQRLDHIKKEWPREYWLSILSIIALDDMTTEAIDHLFEAIDPLSNETKTFELQAVIEIIKERNHYDPEQIDAVIKAGSLGTGLL